METFAISPAASKPLWWLLVICLLLLSILTALVYTAYSSRYSRVEVSGEGIRLVGDFWGRSIAARQLRVSEAKILDFRRDSSYRPKRRNFGTGLPGYASGWFRLANGEKALLYLTKQREVVYLPTTNNYALMLSVEEPERFLATLRRHTDHQ